MMIQGFIFDMDGTMVDNMMTHAGCPCIIITTTHRQAEFKAFPNVVKFIKDFSELSVKDCLMYHRL
jgi:phosphoglycolate phosphatase-like HAD superfamily hydrolase